jgi:hypothetical protein
MQAGSAVSFPVTSGIKSLKMSPQELRIRVRALIRPTLGTIEESADRIIADTSDPVVRRGALVLKIEMSTTMLTAMLRNDPVLALADAWGYVLQCEDAIKRPETAARYGKYAPKTAEMLASLDGQFREFVSGIQAGPFADSLAASLRTWADQNPIKGVLYRRPSMDSAAAKSLAASGDGGVFASLGSLDETAADMMTRMDLYTMYLPRLARWEAELAADDMTGGVDTRKLTAEFERLTKAADRLAAAAESASDQAARVDTRDLTAEFERFTRAADRLAAVAESAPGLAAREREAVLDDVRRERIATLRELEAIAQRLADHSATPIDNAMRTDMKEFVSSVEEMRKRLMVDTGQRLEQVVDHAFLRLVQLLLVCAVVAVLGLVLRRYLFRR